MQKTDRSRFGVKISLVTVLAVLPCMLAAEAFPSAEDGGPRRLSVSAAHLEMYSKPSLEAEKIGRFESGATFHNMGCTELGGDTWCHVRPIRGGARGFVYSKDLAPARGPDGVVAFGRDDSKARAKKRRFDANDDVPCAQEQGQQLGVCAAAVAHGGGGDATIVVTFPNGFARELYFVHGLFTRASATMSGVGTDNDWTLKNGTYEIRVDDQRYVLKESFVLGN